MPGDGCSACALDDQSSCPHTSPHRLTPHEVRTIEDMVTALEYRQVPTAAARQGPGVPVDLVPSRAEVRLAPPPVHTGKSIWSRFSTSRHDLGAMRAVFVVPIKTLTPSRPLSLLVFKEVTGRAVLDDRRDLPRGSKANYSVSSTGDTH
jgi:hypothetical protein